MRSMGHRLCALKFLLYQGFSYMAKMLASASETQLVRPAELPGTLLIPTRRHAHTVSTR